MALVGVQTAEVLGERLADPVKGVGRGGTSGPMRWLAE
jgi:hypothetical protein